MTDDKRKSYKVVKSFEDIEVFQLAYRLSLTVHKSSLTFPAIEQFALGDQLRKASKSICANIAEGYGKQKNSTAEFKRFLLIALGSSDEMRVWSRYCLDLSYIDAKTWQDWRDGYARISRMLQGLINKL
jgi:four helix bundle protein